MWWLLWVGCSDDDPAQPPPEVEGEAPDACAGFAEIDVGDDGVVDRYARHVIADAWDVHTTWEVATPDDTETIRKERDDRGDLVLQVFDVRYDEFQLSQVVTWDRDDQGRELVVTTTTTQEAVSGMPDELREVYTWDGPLVDRIDRFADGQLVQVVTRRYDTDGRLIEELLAPGPDVPGALETRTWTYFEPAPSLDHHLVQDMDTDGRVEFEADLLHDEAGRVVQAETAYHPFQRTSTYGYAYDEAGREVREYVEWDGDPSTVRETLTTWDPDGHVLEVLVRGPEGRVASRTTWSWHCP